MMNILFTVVGRRIELLQPFRDSALVLNKELNTTAWLWLVQLWLKYVPSIEGLEI